MLLPIIVSVIVFVAVILVTVALFIYLQKKESLKIQSQRLEQVVSTRTLLGTDTAEAAQTQETGEYALRRDTRISTIPWLNELLSKSLKERAKSIMTLIEQSGLKIKVSEFVLFVALVSISAVLILTFVLHNFLFALGGLASGFIPFWLMGFLKERRITSFVNQLSQALDLLSSDLRAGLDVMSGIKHLSEEFPAPLGEEFAKVIVEVNLGLSLTEALNNLSRRVNTMDVQILCTGIIINRELGGNLSELIGGIANTVRERFRLKGMIKALTAESQMSAIFLIVLPIGLYFLLNIMAPSTYNDFAKEPTGQAILIGCMISMGIGYYVMQKITKIEV